jgi:hypothetical protein
MYVIIYIYTHTCHSIIISTYSNIYTYMYTIVELAADLVGLRLNVPETCECWGGVARASSGCFLGLKMAIPPKVAIP